MSEHSNQNQFQYHYWQRYDSSECISTIHGLENLNLQPEKSLAQTSHIILDSVAHMGEGRLMTTHIDILPKGL